MKIQPSQSDTAAGVRSRAAARPEAGKSGKSEKTEKSDAFKPEQNQRLAQALLADPDIRPEMIEKARRLAADPNYPSADVLKEVAKRLFGQD